MRECVLARASEREERTLKTEGGERGEGGGRTLKTEGRASKGTYLVAPPLPPPQHRAFRESVHMPTYVCVHFIEAQWRGRVVGNALRLIESLGILCIHTYTHTYTHTPW
jgi:hypothetical protein